MVWRQSSREDPRIGGFLRRASGISPPLVLADAGAGELYLGGEWRPVTLLYDLPSTGVAEKQMFSCRRSNSPNSVDPAEFKRVAPGTNWR